MSMNTNNTMISLKPMKDIQMQFSKR